MSHVSLPFDPLLDASYHSPEQQRILAVGGVGMALGIAGLCALPLVAVPVTSEYFGRGGVIIDHGAINTWGVVSTNLGCALAAMAFLGGMACLRLWPWARPIMLTYGILSIALGLTGIYFHILILLSVRTDDGLPEFATRVSSLAEWVAWVVGTIFGAWTVFIMARKKTAMGLTHPQSP